MKKILAVFAVAVGVAGCPSSDDTMTKTPAKTEVPAVTTAAPAATATTAAAGGPKSTLTATVAFTGTAPAPKKIKKTTECGTDPLLDEEVVAKDGKLANVLVRVVDGAPAQDGSGQGIEVVQEKCVYKPRVAGIVAGQSIAVTSKDNFLHNVHTFKGDETIFNKGQSTPSTFVKEAADLAVKGEQIKNGPITFKCDVHPWMVSHVVVNPNPYFAVSGMDGMAKIELPAGKYKVEAWHEKFGVKTADVTVEEGKPAELKFEYSGSEGKT
jgi:plastocyanin